MRRVRFSTWSAFTVIVLLACTTQLFAPAAIGQEKEGETAKPAADEKEVPLPPAEEKKEEPRLDAIKLDVKERRIEVMGRFCLREGILDYLAVTVGGQEYESVVAVNCSGSRLHAALIAIGCEPGPTPQMMELLRKNPPKDRELPKQVGTALDVRAEWEVDGKAVSVPATDLLINRKLKKPQPAGLWTFTGSYFAKDFDGKQFYMADVDRALVSVVYMGAAVINFNEDAGNPYAAEDEGYQVNSRLAPPGDTPVKLVITPAKVEKKEGE